MIRRGKTVLFRGLVAGIVLAAAGCAGSAGGVRPTAALPPAGELDRYRVLQVEVTKVDGVEVGSTETERIMRRVIEAIQKKAPERFAEINGKPGEGTQPRLQMSVELTRYDKGSSFARFMLAGLGQIHIDGRVKLTESPNDTPLAVYEVTKTFAWGGIYGGSTSIEDVEVGFAEGVADAILGRK